VPCQTLARAIAAIELETVGVAGAAVEARADRRISIAVTAGSGAPRAAYVAAAGIDGKRLGWRDGGSLLGLFKEAEARELEQGADAFRSKRILALSSPDVTSIAVERAGVRLSAERSSQEAPWSGRAGSVAFPVDGTRVDAMIDRLRQLTAIGFWRARAVGRHGNHRRERSLRRAGPVGLGAAVSGNRRPKASRSG
jgi:hypothetical protein